MVMRRKFGISDRRKDTIAWNLSPFVGAHGAAMCDDLMKDEFKKFRA
jgi:hypothetical protein